MPKPDDDLKLRQNSNFVEMQIPCCDGSLYAYLIPEEEGGTWVAACWDDTFDFLLEIDSDDVVMAIESKWPVTARQLSNGLRGHYQNTALLRIMDHEENRKKWAVVTKLEERAIPDTVEAFWNAPLYIQAIERVQKMSAQLFEEIKDFRDEEDQLKNSILLADCERKEDALYIQFGLLEF